MSKYSQNDINIFHLVQRKRAGDAKNGMSIGDNMYDYYYELAF
jgi:hypothetical protein